MDREAELRAFSQLPLIGNRAVVTVTDRMIPGSTVPLPTDLPTAWREALLAQGIQQLYPHQLEVQQLSAHGHDVALMAGTSGGKTLAGALAYLGALYREPMARAILVYPTKALAYDQLTKLQPWADALGMRIATYDADTPKSHRAAIRDSAQILLTNPDMLHHAILPSHEIWGKFLRSLRWVVLDEFHTYRGVFGAHCQGVFFRLQRLAEWKGGHLQYLGLSATLSDPASLFRSLTGREPIVVEGPHAPRGTRHLILAQSEGEEDGPTPNNLTAMMVAEALKQDFKTLVFCRSRQACEIVARTARNFVGEKNATKIESYRGGYSAKERRAVEKSFLTGKTRAMVATSAMELGVDVGDLDIVLLNGLPGTIASFRQQIGRCARSGRPGLAIALAHQSGYEQWLLARPERLLEGAAEPVPINDSNPIIWGQQLRCAAFERPIAPDEMREPARNAADQLCESGELALSAGRYYYPSHQNPAAGISIRGIGRRRVQYLVGQEVLTEMEWDRARRQGHPGAVYLHRGETFEVREVDWAAGVGRLEPLDSGFYTQVQEQAYIEPQMTLQSSEVGVFGVELASVRALSIIHGFRRIPFAGADGAGYDEEVDVPIDTLNTIGVRIIPMDGLDPAREDHLAAIHAVEHALRIAANPLVGCEPDDLGSYWTAQSPEGERPEVTLFDRVEGGIGLAESLYRLREIWLEDARQILRRSANQSVGSTGLYLPQCEADNALLDDAGALRLFWSEGSINST